MKTYSILCALFAFVILSCAKSENPSEDLQGQNVSVDADYVALLSKDGLQKPQLLNANAEIITLNPATSSLVEKSIPDLSFIDGSDFLQYRKDGNCGGQIVLHDFKADKTTDIPIFSDLNDCDLSATAIAKSGSSLFVAYTVTSVDPPGYMVRHIDLTSSDFSFVDVTIDKKPVDLTIANNRLFILTIDELITDENSLTVVDMSNNSLMHEMGLGYSVRRIFTDVEDNIIISYDELHTTLSSSSMAFAYTQYEESTAPKFSSSQSANFDLEGRLYYPMDAGTNSGYPLVPAIYDFANKLVILYAYENFLTEAERNFEYEIETTTAVAYDEKNGLMLVGYKKVNEAIKAGGLLRIRIAPEPELIDNIELDGIPTEILVN